jgi:hypothetical protein
VKNVNDILFSPSGKLVAVGGTAGLQIFHFNGANPLTRATGLLTIRGAALLCEACERRHSPTHPCGYTEILPYLRGLRGKRGC